jgi:hypothetical protein
MLATDFTKPDLGPERAAAEAAGLANAAPGLLGADGCRLADSDPLAPHSRAIARSMTEASMTVHHCAPRDPLYRLGGVCLLPVLAGSAVGSEGVAVSWTTHNLLLDWDRHGTHVGAQQAMKTAIGGILRAFRYVAEPFGSGGAWLVTGHRHQGPGAGQ